MNTFNFILKFDFLIVRGSNSSLNNLRQSLMIADNPRRGSATGVYGLPVPPDNLKLGGTHIPSECNSLNDSPNNSGRNSPIGWTQHQSNHDKRKVKIFFKLLENLFIISFISPQVPSNKRFHEEASVASTLCLM